MMLNACNDGGEQDALCDPGTTVGDTIATWLGCGDAIELTEEGSPRTGTYEDHVQRVVLVDALSERDRLVRELAARDAELSEMREQAARKKTEGDVGKSGKKAKAAQKASKAAAAAAGQRTKNLAAREADLTKEVAQRRTQLHAAQLRTSDGGWQDARWRQQHEPRLDCGGRGAAARAATPNRPPPGAAPRSRPGRAQVTVAGARGSRDERQYAMRAGRRPRGARAPPLPPRSTAPLASVSRWSLARDGVSAPRQGELSVLHWHVSA